MKSNSDGSFRFFIVAILLAMTTAFLASTRRAENVPMSRGLELFPVHLGNWTGRDLELDRDTLQVLGPGDFLSRDYVTPGELPVNLFVAYFPSQRAGDAIHSPKNCLPGAGWMPVESSRVVIPASGTSVKANRYVVQKGLDRDLVIYWYQAHGRTVASEYWAKLYLVADAIRMNRTDGALVRIVIPILGPKGSEPAEQQAVAFTQQLLPILEGYIPR
jgi:EpsI family protein